MKLEYFIAKRLITTKNYKSSISAPIIKIAITAIALGLIMMLISVATGLGLKYKIRDKISAFSGHVVISNYDANETDLSLNSISLKQDFYPKFKTITGIKKVEPFAVKAGIIRTANAFEGILLKGVGADYNWKALQEYLVAGRLPKFGESMSQEVLISELIANRLDLKAGDKITTHFIKETGNKLPNVRQFQIVGIYNSGLQEFDSNFVIGDLRQVQRLNRWKADEVGGFEVVLADFDKIEEKGMAIYEELPSTLNSQTIVEKYGNIFNWIAMFDFNIAVILVIMVIVASINMIVALLVLILERTQMIGVLKALGANNWVIRKIFLYNSAYLIAIGLFWGNLFGIGLLLIQQYFGLIKLDPNLYYVKEAPVLLRFTDVLWLNGGVVVICLVVLLIPSYLITKISPVKAMRFD
ncbi:FtsX-like permease family protein [Flavobacterium sp. HSC-61S13]|uniref:ABC transporter permease n=1 Tax=Flavobacterium sp. HSC-61S13 TaxID=2910963 RepID=UPI0020A1A914|nr:FtsX-like permease family protein [Flavobacterium sp. HSC-61S13]MCP1996956.1 lipoprotein-releasing system permease protein [Flavobacterium sp. HSC-61S13]